MPRGIYDRSKTKEQRASEKAKAEKKDAAPKRKYTRRTPVVAQEYVAKYEDKKAYAKASNPDTDFFLMGEARSNLNTLMNVSTLFGDLPSVKSEVDAHVEVLGQFRKKLLSQDTENTSLVSSNHAEAASDEEVEDDQSVVQTPIANVPLPTVRQSPMAMPPVAPVLPAH